MDSQAKRAAIINFYLVGNTRLIYSLYPVKSRRVDASGKRVESFRMSNMMCVPENLRVVLSDKFELLRSSPV